MLQQSLYIWKQAPFLRLVIPLMAGIVLQWYVQPPPQAAWFILFLSLVVLMGINGRVSFFRFRNSWITGLLLNLLLIASGALVTYYKDISHHRNWVNHVYRDSSLVIATLSEPLTEKPKTWKTVGAVQQVTINGISHEVSGNIIIYFQKDSTGPLPGYGNQVAFSRPLQSIRSAGNPGSFNYQRYAAFQHIYHQVFLRKQDYVVLPGKSQDRFTLFLLSIRQWVLRTITRYIPDKKAAGLAEALLIGYKDDLDKALVQTYSNTGVIHVIAISGLHVGIIYWLLVLLTSPLKKRKKTNWLPALVIVAGLWLFALLAGAGPSVLRSALMFTVMAIGDRISKKASVYNSLAASAFLLLCYHPFWLWDAGFQLSYTAVLSIVIFMKPFYNLLYIQHKIPDMLWKLNSVTLSAQLLTMPVSIYHFHQFPNYFLITNLVAVPLSSVILIGELLLCAVSGIPPLAEITGALLQWMIIAMNRCIGWMEKLPFSVWKALQINITQLLAMYLVIAGGWYWLRKKNTTGLITLLCCTGLFFALRSHAVIKSSRQQKLVVYHVPGHQAIDFIDGGRYYFKGDSALLANQHLQAVHLEPARILFRVQKTDSLPALFDNGNACLFGNKKIIIADSSLRFMPPQQKIKADLLILSGNPRISIDQLKQTFDCKKIIIDASNRSWKVNIWKLDCQKSGLDCHYVVDKGAFVMNLR